jgi:rod shape determining protein RodA
MKTPSRAGPYLWLTIAGLMVIGALFVYSATMANESTNSLPWHRQFYFKQLVWYGLGSFLAFVVSLVDYRRFTRWALVYYWVTIILLVLVLIPGVGKSALGGRRWIDLGVFQLQPSEFAKLALILALAQFLGRPVDELRERGVFFKALGMTLLPFGLIVVEPDLGSALVLLPICLATLHVAGAPNRFLGRLLAFGLFVVGAIIADIVFAPPKWQIKMADYQKQRLWVYFRRDFEMPNSTVAERLKLQRDKNYNSEQALISVGSGGVMGKGWRKGTQNMLGFLPRAVAHNDFIFSVIAEEKGFVGGVTVVALYTVILFIGLRIADEARDRLGRLVASGVVAMFFSHVFINIGMNISIMPVTGIPLPLLSYGGSSVLCSLIALGVLHNIDIYKRHY